MTTLSDVQEGDTVTITYTGKVTYTDGEYSLRFGEDGPWIEDAKSLTIEIEIPAKPVKDKLYKGDVINSMELSVGTIVWIQSLHPNPGASSIMWNGNYWVNTSTGKELADSLSEYAEFKVLYTP